MKPKLTIFAIMAAVIMPPLFVFVAVMRIIGRWVPKSVKSTRL